MKSFLSDVTGTRRRVWQRPAASGFDSGVSGSGGRGAGVGCAGAATTSVLSVVFLLLATVSGLSAGPAAAAAPACAPYMAYFVPGTGETNDKANGAPVGMLKGAADQLKKQYGSSLGTYFVPYPAGMPADGGGSVRAGAAALKAAILRCPASKILIAGYSQGADAAGDVAADIGNGKGPVPASQVRAVTLLADPQNGTKGAVQAGDPVKGVGIGGVREEGFGELSGLVKEWCNFGDKYCDTDPNSSPLTASLGRILSGDNPPVSLPVFGSAGKPAGGDAGNVSTKIWAPTAAKNGSPASAVGEAAKLATPMLSPEELNRFTTLLQPQDYTKADLAGAPATVKSLTASVNDLVAGGGAQTPAQLGQLAGIRSQAQSLLDTFQPIMGTSKWIGGNKTVSTQLASAPAGSPQKATSDLLGGGALNTTNLSQIISGASELVKTSDSMLGTSRPTPTPAATGTGAAPSGTAAAPQTGGSDAQVVAAPTQAVVASAPKVSGINDQALNAMQLNTKKIGTGSSGLSGSPADLSQVSSVLSSIQPETVLKGVGTAIQAAVTTDYQGVVQNLQALPGTVLSGNIPQAHKLTSGLLAQMKPLVQAASGVDYGSLSKIIGLVPDSSGTASGISMVLALLSNLDFVRGYNAVAQLNDQVFHFLETGNLLELASMVPVGMELAQVAMGLVAPAPKQSPDNLGKQVAPQTGATQNAVASGDFQQVGTQLLALASSPQAGNLMDAAKEGIDFASFFQNGVPPKHVEYASNGKVTALTSALKSGLDG